MDWGFFVPQHHETHPVSAPLRHPKKQQQSFMKHPQSMTHPIAIREARSGDLESLVDFSLAMALETESKHLHRETVIAGVAGCLEVPARGFYLVAECSGQVVGSLMVTREWSDWRNGDFWWIQSVYVIPEFRKNGVFRSLYSEARRRALASDQVCGCRLYVEKHNQSAQAVYRKFGFSETDYRFYEEEFVDPEKAGG
jgi:ribosomal protein S18 acetylase RimI-like enzyme